jgi:hypothetical protein
VLWPAGFKIRDIMTQTARERAVLIAGGAVARDYFDLLIAAADAGWEAAQRSNNEANEPFTIGAEDVQAAPCASPRRPPRVSAPDRRVAAGRV